MTRGSRAGGPPPEDTSVDRIGFTESTFVWKFQNGERFENGAATSVGMSIDEITGVYEFVAAQPGFNAAKSVFTVAASGYLALSAVGIAEMKGKEFDRDHFSLEFESTAGILERSDMAAIGFHGGKKAFVKRGDETSEGERIVKAAMAMGDSIDKISSGDKGMRDNDAGLISISFKHSVADTTLVAAIIAKLDKAECAIYGDMTTPIKFFLDTNVACKMLDVKRDDGKGGGALTPEIW